MSSKKLFHLLIQHQYVKDELLILNKINKNMVVKHVEITSFLENHFRWFAKHAILE